MRKFVSLGFLLAAVIVTAPNILSEECCQIAGDGNDDGIVDIHDYWFLKGWYFGKSGYVPSAKYPDPRCFDQMVWTVDSNELIPYNRITCSNPPDTILDTTAHPFVFYDFTPLVKFLFTDTAYPECGEWEF